MLTRITFADYQLRTLLHTTDEQMSAMSENITAAIDNSLNTTIREGYESDAIQYMQQIIGYQTDLDLLQNVVTPILREVIEPNMVIDQEATAKLQEEASAAVEPVIYKQGQNIVLSREKITSTQLAMLRSLGLIDDGNVDVIMYVGAAMLVLVGLLLLCSMLWLLDRQTLYNVKRLIILLLILVITLILCVFGQMINPYFVPTLLAVMMITGLLGAPAAIAGCFTVSVLVVALIAASDGAYGTETVNLLLTTFTSGILSIILIKRRPYRMHVLICGVITALSNYIVILAVGFMTSTSIADVFISGIWSSASAIVAAILCIAFDPLIESVFHLATPARLLELSNPNHPLLRRLLIEASGTYHHSIIVANLAEAAAEDIGANPLLARVGAYFHDIGKLKRPLYFKENQMGENPHDHTNPYVSAAIVTSHTRDGLVMAQQAHLPQEILDIIEEHHGDTPVMYFYHAACQQSEEPSVDIADFRYNGKRPHTKESAIVMLADTVEAAVRSLPDPTPQSIRDFITKLVTGKMSDDQLTQAPLTLSDVTKICDAFAKVLNGVFHERIEYPSISMQAAAKVAQLPKSDAKTKSLPTKPEETKKDAN